ncbi:Predicted pyrophosphatase or phosphodiesterase, AlkP superfamily [Granulicatella balaenopterae]|uniref:Predicted pyrophosphatase or phosphodiesterase, AlkP superfamily n=1 Tax=Granulicatella balaenopterae TaxID=137733 RepID=A0A1H9GY04_9LACT|nr:alkaline phosphatase family protein [Granulicatella balaenopterae]SEQ54888.1 Predicted pyrophosphatase or phosphodiesterase, AlkP superfamily [Granulicatella balaenopterae]
MDKKHVIVLSYDAFSELDFDKAKEYPNFKRLLQNSYYSKELTSVYPTMTYVIHSTIVTGVYPDKHKVLNNYIFEPFLPANKKSWHWYREQIKADTIYDACKRQGLTTASIMWPVSGKAAIKYNFPEVVAINKENQALKLLKSGSPFFCMKMAAKYGRKLKGASQPELDNFTTDVLVDTILTKKPNLVMGHLIELDDTKHNYGIDQELVLKPVYERMDHRIGKVLDAVEEAGIKESTSIILLGDHGQFTVKKELHLNQLLVNNGYIWREGGKWKWKAYFQSTGGAAYLRLKEESTEMVEAIRQLLACIKADYPDAIEGILTSEEMRARHIDESIPLMVEAPVGTAIVETINGYLLEDIEAMGEVRGEHGYSPEKANYHCGFVLSSSELPNAKDVGALQMVDIAPTIAQLLGIDFPRVDGTSIFHK